MISRLKKISNNVTPSINLEVERRVIENDLSLDETHSEAFSLTKSLFADSPYISANNLLYDFSNNIINGKYSSISSVEDAVEHWHEWKEALVNFLKEKKVIAKKKQASITNEQKIALSYDLAKDLINGLMIVPRTALMELLAQDIERGDFDDISSIQDAKKNWQKWLQRARKILTLRNVVLDYK
jgi:hypothetical protein